jgi:GT2 family glycosyltransferase
MPTPNISIIIVNYNVRDYLYNCLQSIRAASEGLEIETIVVDNDSSDGSVEYLRPRFPEVNFIETGENLGFGRANNLGFDNASGKYFLILNPDTIIREDTLKSMFEFMENDTETGIAGCKVLNEDGTFQEQCRRGFPTPWASFSKLFGLQKLFPKSKLFSGYNLTYLPVDETYEVDAVIGAFMFARAEIIRDLKGFDPEFFMYGEDLDLCYRTQKSGYKIKYFHETSIIHYKGESTKRSSINEIRHFYQAMEIFARKHFSGFGFFLLFLRTGIYIRGAISYIGKYSRDFGIIAFDTLILIAGLLLGTYLKFGDVTGFPDYAYPLVFIICPLVMISSMIAAGEYFEPVRSLPRTIFGLGTAFFILSTLTYFFNDYAFSRGALITMIGFSMIGMSLTRLIILARENIAGIRKSRKIAFMGITDENKGIIDKFDNNFNPNITISGIITRENETPPEGLPVIGNVEYIGKTIENYNLDEIIITGSKLRRHEFISLVTSLSGSGARFHLVDRFDDYVVSGIVNEISGESAGVEKYNIDIFRYKLLKKLTDYLFAISLLTFGIPVILFFKNSGKIISQLIEILKGKKTFIGIYPVKGADNYGKPGLTGLAHISRPEQLSKKSVLSLNEYYLKNYSLSLDLDIILKNLFRKRSGKKYDS